MARREAELDPDRAARVGGEVEGYRLPAMRGGEGSGEQRPLPPSGIDAHLERHRLVGHGAQGQVEPGALRQGGLEGQGFRRSRHEGLPEHPGEALPAEAGGDAPEVLLAEHEPYRLDLEAGSHGVRRPQHDVADVRSGKRLGALEGVGAHLLARHDGGCPLGGIGRDDAQEGVEVRLLVGHERHREVAAPGRPHPNLDLVQRVGVAAHGVADMEDGKPGRGPSDEPALLDAEPLDAGDGGPTQVGRTLFSRPIESPFHPRLGRRRGGGRLPATACVEDVTQPYGRRGLRGATAAWAAEEEGERQARAAVAAHAGSPAGGLPVIAPGPRFAIGPPATWAAAAGPPPPRRPRGPEGAWSPGWAAARPRA